jgi:hypothetical protein
LFPILPIPATVGDALTCSRALATATRVNSAGAIETVAANMPRITWERGVDQCPNLLVEKSVVNLDTSPATFAAWDLNNSGGVTISNVVATNPFGYANVPKIIPNAVSGQHRPFNAFTYSAVGVIWGIFKADGYNYLSFGESGGLSGASTIFDLSTGTISTTGSATNPFIVSQGNGWYLCGITMLSTGSQTRFIVVRNANSTADYTGDGTSGVLCCHKQLEVKSFYSSPILLSGGSTTRNADVISKTGIGTLLAGAKGLFIDCYLQAGSLSDGATIIASQVSTDVNNQIYFYRYNNVIGFEVITSGSIVAAGNTTIIAPFKNKRIKLFLSFSLNDIKFYVNAVSAIIDTSALIPLLEKICVGGSLDSSTNWDGLIKAVAVTDEFTEADIEQISSYPSFANMAEQMMYEMV